MDMDKNRPVNQRSLPPVLTVLQDLVHTLPTGCATLTTDFSADGDTFVRLVPRNSDAAPIAARGGGRFHYELVVGEGTLYEIKPEGNYLNRSGVEDLRAICSAVFAGNFQETVYSVGKTVTKTIGKLTTEGKTFETKAWHAFYPLVPKKKKLVQYAPYCDAAGSI
jgi:hypothetical protein